MIEQIRKRDGTIVQFQPAKITAAIGKAVKAVGAKDGGLAAAATTDVVRKLNQKFVKQIPGVEDVQDFVETVLIERGHADVAKAYILYRQKRAEIRAAKAMLGVSDELKLSVNAAAVLQRRYLLRDETGKIIEGPAQMFRRVARAVAAPERKYGANPRAAEQAFYDAMSRLEFLPNSPTLMNASTPLGQLSACFVLPVGDSLQEIFDSVKYAVLIHQSGGGTGFSFSRLRPKGDMVRSTKGVASGPVSFMRAFDTATDIIKQGGKRRGANMGILCCDHPDILDFITVKGREGILDNFNLSVAATDEFMKAVTSGGSYWLVNPRTGRHVTKLRARDVFDLIVTMAWKTGDPGMVFIDEINRHNPTPKAGQIESTNPCGEQPLLPYESCNLGSINLGKLVKGDDIDWNRLGSLVDVGVHFLDNVIDANRYPLPQIEAITLANRKIGLGVMGWADALVQLGIPYDSEQALKLAEKVAAFIQKRAHAMSTALAAARGSFPNFKDSTLVRKHRAMRNATTTTIAPTGTISIIAGCSSGIEPLFAVSFVRNVMEGTRLLEVNPHFELIARERGFYSTELIHKIARTGSVQGMPEVPKDVQRIFVTALDIAPEWHVRMQAAFQRHTDNAVSKTVNFRADASVEDVKRVYLMAYKLKCKGITVYRYGSKRDQVLQVGPSIEREPGEEHVAAHSEYSGGCPWGMCPF